MSKNINSITIIIALLDNEKIKTRKKIYHYHCDGNLEKKNWEKTYKYYHFVGHQENKTEKKLLQTVSTDVFFCKSNGFYFYYTKSNYWL